MNPFEEKAKDYQANPHRVVEDLDRLVELAKANEEEATEDLLSRITNVILYLTRHARL